MFGTVNDRDTRGLACSRTTNPKNLRRLPWQFRQQEFEHVSGHDGPNERPHHLFVQQVLLRISAVCSHQPHVCADGANCHQHDGFTVRAHELVTDSQGTDVDDEGMLKSRVFELEGIHALGGMCVPRVASWIRYNSAPFNAVVNAVVYVPVYPQVCPVQ